MPRSEKSKVSETGIAKSAKGQARAAEVIARNKARKAGKTATTAAKASRMKGIGVTKSGGRRAVRRTRKV